MVSRLLGKLDVRRHLTSGEAWAKAGAEPAARMPAIPAPAVLMNFLRFMWTSSLEYFEYFGVRPPRANHRGAPSFRLSLPRDGHAIDEYRAALLGAAGEHVV